MKTKKNVLHLVEYLYLGGIERLLEQLAIHSKEDVNLFYFTYETTELNGIGKNIAELGLPVFTFKKSPGTDWNLFKSLVSIIQAHKIQVIHTHDFGPMEYAFLLKIRFPWVKLVHTQHTMHHFVIKAKYRYFFQLSSYFYSSIIGVSQYVVDLIKQECPLTNPFALKVIYNGVDTNIYKRSEICLDIHRLNLVNVARISPEKNFEYILNTCLLLQNAGIPFILHHAGTGSKPHLLESYVRFINDNKLSDKVILHGYINEAKKILDMGDIFVTSSKREGHPVALLEAMSCEKLCLCSDIAPHRETVDGKVYLFDLNDEMALFEQLVKIYNSNRNLNESRADIRNVIIDKYSIEIMVHAYGEIYG